MTVIIVSYRTAKLTVKCLHSLAPERESGGFILNVIVVDNASGDAGAILNAIEANGWSSWIRVIQAPKNGGFAYGNNLGIRAVLAGDCPDYLHLVNPDTVVRAGAVGALVDFLESHSEVGIAGSSFENADGREWPIAFRFPSLISEIDSGLRVGVVSRLLSRWTVAKIMSGEPEPADWGAGASMMIRRTVIERIGALDEGFFLYFEETEFCWRARHAGFPFWYVPSSRVMHIAGQSTKLTERYAAPVRMPPYWFESRRRYFVLTHGMYGAMLVDAIAILAYWLGDLKLSLQGRGDRIVPGFKRSLWTHSVLRTRNRAVIGMRLLNRTSSRGMR